MEKRIIELAPTVEIEKREREVQLLMNLAQPDPQYQGLVTDESTLMHFLSKGQADDARARLWKYLAHPIDLTQPIWKLVDDIKTRNPNWPE